MPVRRLLSTTTLTTRFFSKSEYYYYYRDDKGVFRFVAYLLSSKSRGGGGGVKGRQRRSYSIVRDKADDARDVYHTPLDCDQFDDVISRDQSKTRARLLATCSALASMYIGYHAAPLLAEGSINSAMYMVEHEKNFMRKRGVWRLEWLLESAFGGLSRIGGGGQMMVDKCVEKGAMEAVLKVCEMKETGETDEEVREGARKVLATLVKTESGRKRADGDVHLRKRVRRALGKEH